MEGFWGSNPSPFLGKFSICQGFLRKENHKTPLNFPVHTKKFKSSLESVEIRKGRGLRFLSPKAQWGIFEKFVQKLFYVGFC